MGTFCLHITLHFLTLCSLPFKNGNGASNNGFVSGETMPTPTPHLLFERMPEKNPRFLYGSLHTLNRLTEWSMKEEHIVQVLGNRLELIEKEIKLITSYLEDYKESTGKAIDGLLDPSLDTPEGRGKVVGSSSVLAHRMTDRYTSTIVKLQALLSSEIYSENQRSISKVLDLKLIQQLRKIEEMERVEIFGFPINKELHKNESPHTNENSTGKKNLDKLPIWPKHMDSYMSDLSFIHLHEVYGYNPEDLRQGLLIDTKFGGLLNAKQCAEIGVLALARHYYYIAIEWLELSKSLSVSSTEKDDSIPVDFVSSLLDIAIKEHNLGLRNDTLLNEIDFYMRPTYENQPKQKRVRMRKYIYANPDGENDQQLTALSRYWGLCSGVTFQTPKEQIHLKCFYNIKSHPYLYINPLKTEVLAENPPLLQFYDVLGNDTIEKIKNISVPRVDLSQVLGTTDFEELTQGRTSAGTFIEYKELPKLYEHSEIVSGLKLRLASEMGQAVEYTYGRFYSYHTDALEDEEETLDHVGQVGDRVATLLYYVETADFGGDTPFCSAGVNARPVRGSAILWYSMHRNGTIRQDVLHGACPVVHGHKIIINHWMRYNGNWNHYKCTLNQFE